MELFLSEPRVSVLALENLDPFNTNQNTFIITLLIDARFVTEFPLQKDCKENGTEMQNKHPKNDFKENPMQASS
ncbi:hypothetical protein SAMN03080594_109141 [Arenibacter palladensis]|uniref:Uncharacterized protein n=1 Tax=Arenibacter palladensis TaxID=237373 RepID=A0A1M5FN59_9FLAO|nr:hypothetical protein [Arenibacter palladensis]SHF92869.1 hypothetical protein SAMN03080594_109141 [Arenibacter palladensis]